MAAVDQMEIQKKLKEFITETFLVGSDFDNIENSDSFMEKEIVDSTGVLELTAFVETEFNITIEDNEMTPDNLDSIEKLVSFIARKSG